jgi:ribosomal protein S6
LAVLPLLNILKFYSRAIPRKGGIPMREYELIYIIHPELDETAVNENIEKINAWITEADGEITQTDIWGKRKLAYPILKQEEGFYVFSKIKIKLGVGLRLYRSSIGVPDDTGFK